MWDDPELDTLKALAELPLYLEDECGVKSDMGDIEVQQSPADTSTAPIPANAVPLIPERPVLYYVSSHHLMLASHVFCAALVPQRWNEGHKKADGRYYITADDWDEQAFFLLMNMLHARTNQVPEPVSLEMLTKIGVLIDYYDCGNAVEFFTTAWLRNLRKNGLRYEYSRKLILWLWISYIFRKEDVFQRATRIAIAYCNESSLRTLGLPILDLVLGKLVA